MGTALLDGKPIDRTPIERLTVPASHHVISVIFGGHDPPRTLSYAVDLTVGETKDIVADFTRPSWPARPRIVLRLHSQQPQNKVLVCFH